MSKQRTRFVSILVIALFALSLMPSLALAEASEYAEHLTIRWYQEKRDLPEGGDRVLQAIQDKFNVTFEFIEPPADGSSDRLNLMVSTGDALDWILAFDVDLVAYQWAADDFIYSYDELIGDSEDYPLISKLLAGSVFDHLKVNDKSYFKPQPLWAGNRGYVINQDWLDNLGLEVPTTIDEYYEVVKAFKEQDPDGNGQDDTFGFYVAEERGSNTFGYIGRGFANSGNWGGDWVALEDGTITQYGMSDYARETYRFLSKCYDEELFNRGFVNELDAFGKVEDLFLQQKIGITDLSQPATLINKMEEAGVEMNVTYLPPLTVNGEQGFLPHSGGYWSFHLIPRTCQDPYRVLDIMEWALTEEGRAMTMFGIEGLHWDGYETIGETRVYNINKEEMSADWNTNDYGYLYPLSWGGFNYCENAYIPLDEYDTFDEAYANMQVWTDTDPSGTMNEYWRTENSKYATTLPLQGVIDESVKVPQTLIDIEIAGRTKAIVEGQENFDKNWDEWVELWMSQGGAELIERGNEYYAAH